MKKYKIEVIETLSRIVPVEAESLQQAYSIVIDKYKKGNIILDSSDYTGTEFDCYCPKENKHEMRT